MAFRALKLKLKSSSSVDHTSEESGSSSPSQTSVDDQQVFNLSKLQNEIESKERSLHISITHHLIALDANIDDIKSLIDQKRPEETTSKSSICDLWLRLKAVEQMGPVSLITFLRKHQLNRTEERLCDVHDDSIEIQPSFLINPRRSRLTHFHLCAESDEFHFNIDSYVGLLIFSYENQSKFILNNHHCQRGDILIKEMKFFGRIQKAKLYGALFKWYFARSIDQQFFGLGFLYVTGKWRYDLIAFDDRDLLSYEYRIVDMYLLTHWLTELSEPRNVQEMEMKTKDLLLEQFELVKKKLDDVGKTRFLNECIGFIGSDTVDLKLSVEKFLQTTEKEIESIFKEPNGTANAFSSIFTGQLSSYP